MKRRARHAIKWTSWGLAVAFAAAAAILLVALTTEPGARVTLRMLATRLGVELEFADLQGSLLGPLSLTGIEGATATLQFEADHLTIDWRPFQLIRGRVHLDSMLLVGVRAVLKEDTTETAEPTTTDTLPASTSDTQAFELPVALVFEKFQLADGVVTVSDSISVGDISLAASGTHDNYQVELTATLTAPNVGQARLESSGRGSMRDFSVEELRALVLDGEVRGSGAFSWQPGVEWQIELNANGLTPSLLAPKPEDWPGQVSLSAAIDGRLQDGRPEMEVRVDTLYGTLRSQPLTGVMRAAISGTEYSFDRVDVDWGPLQINVAGVVNRDRLDLDFDLQAPDLAAVLPRSSGSVSASGRLAGSPSAPVINATATASAVVLDQFRLRQADARVDVDWRDRGTTAVVVRISDLEYANQAIDSVQLLVSGSRSAHDVEAAFASTEADILLTASGGITDWTWSGVLGDFGITTRRAGEWRLDEPASLTASRTAVTLEELCMLASEGDFCIAGAWESQADWQLSSSMNELPFSLLQPLLPQGLTIDGTVSGQVNAAGTTDTPEYVELDLRPGSGTLEYVLRDTVVTALTYREVQLTVNAAGDSLRGDLSMQLAESDSAEFGTLSAEVGVASLTELIDAVFTEGLVNALSDEWRLESSIDRISFSLLRPLLPQGLAVDGSVSGEVSAAGRAVTPDYVELDLRPGPGSLEYAFRDTVVAVTYREAHATVHANGDSLRGSLSMQLAESDSAEFGTLSAEVGVASLTELIDAVSTEGLVEALSDEWRLESSIDRISFSLLSPLLPQGWAVDGSVSGEVSAAGRAVTPDYVELDLRPGPGSLEYAFRDTVVAVTYREAQLTVNTLSDSLHGNLNVQLAEADGTEFGSLSAEVVFPSLGDLLDEIATDGFVAALQDEWMLGSSIDQIPLAVFNVFLPPRATLAGSLDGTLEAVAAPDGTITGQLELAPRTATSQRSFGNEVHTIRLIDAQVRAQAGPDGVQGEATFSVARPDSPTQGAVTASIALPQLTRLDQPLRSQPLEARVESSLDLSLLDELSNDFSGSAGQLEIDLTAGNTLGEMEFTGDYQLRGQTDILSLGIDLRDIDIRASESPAGGLQIEGGVSSGDGRLTIAGTSPTIPTRESPARLTIRGERFRAMRTEQISLVVSPDIEVLIGGRAVEVNGAITVPRATIEILEVPQTAVRASKDVVYIDDTVVTDDPPLEVTANVTLALGENVVFRGFGFNTHLDGTVVATDQPGRTTQGRGELVLREGIYRGYGQSLAIEPGRLVFAGPIDDPTVDVRAYRQADDGTRAGFLVAGTLKSPTVEIWSDPAKTDSDALSYILFGRSLSQGTEADQQQAGSAAAVLGGNMLAMSMASAIGLDDARIETGARRQDAAFYAGKYISPKLYVAYGVGLYEPINVLRVRYLISRKFTLQAETGTRDSGDILYRIEF